MKVFKIICPIVGLFLLLVSMFSQAGMTLFQVKDIRIEGIDRISASTVFSYLPIKIGQNISQNEVTQAMHDLYKTKFFQDVSIHSDDDILVIVLKERPSIARVNFEGNKEIETQDLESSLKAIGLAEGRVYDEGLLQLVVDELKRQYYSLGRYSVRIDPKVQPLERNRVGIKINISEGLISKIREINIVGNQYFKDDEILGEMELSTPDFYTLFSSNDKYSKHKLSADLEKIRSFYLDQGFIDFNLSSTQVSVTPDKHDVYININIYEGERFNISEIKVSGDLILTEQELLKLILLKKGEVYSRKQMALSTEDIMKALGEKGYAFAQVKPIPDIDAQKKTVKLNFFIDPGHRTYVRRINIYGNTLTADHVVRRELRQDEGAWLSTSKVARGKERLDRLGYFKPVQVDTKPVPGTTDQVDVNYKLEEQSTGNLNLGVGYSQLNGIIANFSIKQKNFLGTGNTYSVGVDNSQVNTLYHFSVTEPYFTDSGVSRSWFVTHKKTDQNAANLSHYNTVRDAIGLSFNVPINEYNSYGFGVDVERLRVGIPGDGSDTNDNVIDFVEKNGGDRYLTLKLHGSWAHDSRNRAIFPDRGALMRINAEAALPGSEFKFFKLAYKQTQYFPLNRKLTLMLTGDVGTAGIYSGLDIFPPFEHYFSGGIRSVRGFRDNTLGVRDSKTSKAIGGRFKVGASSEVIFPVPFVKDSSSYRLSGFIDAGNVFSDINSFNGADIRFSSGIMFAWMSPFGLLQFSLAKPLNDQPGDNLQMFQFTFGTSF